MFFKCNVSGTVVSAQYGRLCCLFAPAVSVVWLAAECPQSIGFLSTVHFCYTRYFWSYRSTMVDFFLNQRSDLEGVSNTQAV